MSDIREKIAEEINEARGGNYWDESLITADAILSLVREAVSAVKPREIRTTPYVSGKKPTRTSTKAKWHNKALSDYHDVLMEVLK